MARRVNYTQEDKFPIIVQSGEIDKSTSLDLVGSNVLGFGKSVNENFLHLLERFASSEPPRNPIEGQLWFNRGTGVLYRFTSLETWKPVSGLTVTDGDPKSRLGETEGDFWMNSQTQQMFVFISGRWRSLLNIDQNARWIQKTRMDTIGGVHQTLELLVNNRTVSVFSGDIASWVPDASELLTNTQTPMVEVFPEIQYSLNLINRRTIPEITVDDNPPITGQYTRNGDFWVSPATNSVFSYYNGGWNRISNQVFVNSDPPTSANIGEDGDLWIDVELNQLYYFSQLNEGWQPVLANTTFSESDPGDSFTPLPGSFWVNTVASQLYVFNGEIWIKLSSQSDTTGFFTAIRFDNATPENQPHEVLECRVNSVPVIVISSDENTWNPSDFEIAFQTVSYNSLYPQINPGVNVHANLMADLVIGNIVATESQALAGIANDVVMTPLRTKQYLDQALDDLQINDDPSLIVSPIESGTFVNYYSEAGYASGTYPQPTNEYVKYLEAFLLGNQGNLVRIDLFVAWSNNFSSELSETPMTLDYQIIRTREDGGDQRVVASGVLSTTVAAGDFLEETSVLRSVSDKKITHMTESTNSTMATERMKYTLELRRRAGEGESSIYFAWMTVSHINFTVSVNGLIPVILSQETRDKTDRGDYGGDFSTDWSY